MPASSVQIMSEPIHTILEKIVSSHAHAQSHHLTLVSNFLQPELHETSGIIRFEEPQTRTSCNILLVLPGTLGLPSDLTGGDLEWIIARVGHFSSSFLFQSRSQSSAQLTTLPTVPLGILLINALERWKEHKTKSHTRSVDMLLEASWRRGTVGTVTRRDGQGQRVYEPGRGLGVERRGRIAEIVQEFCNEGK